MLVIAAGAVEGRPAIGQYTGMRVHRPPPGRWIGATAGAAAFAWTLGMLPSTLGLDLASAMMLILVAIGAVLLLVSIPLAQWLALSRPRTALWVPVNAGAWLVSILWTFAPSPFIDERSPVPLVVALYVTAGVLMAVTSLPHGSARPQALLPRSGEHGRCARRLKRVTRRVRSTRTRGPATVPLTGVRLPIRTARRRPVRRRSSGDRRSCARADGIRARRVPSAAR